jgi:poly [ADP-ribose] polymerase
MPNLCAILKNGMVVDPSKLGINVCITGKMFGLGLYFTNTCSKSIQYCAYNISDGIACLFVAEVALGKQWEKKQADSSITAQNLPKPYNSVWGTGRSTIDKYDEYDDNTRIPCGKIKQVVNAQDRSLLYDEFVVYHEEQVNLRYIIMLKVTDDN